MIYKKNLRSRLQTDFNYYPVFVTKKDMENFYNGFCNKTIWPLFHYFPSYTIYNEDYWASYKRVNEAFCDAVLEIIKPDDVVWIHDYHLMLLPGLLREKITNPIGYFHHIPFPTYEIFRLLPSNWRNEILNGILGADLIGFHTFDYTQYFLRCILCTLGYEHNMGEINLNGHIIKVDTFPMGIDYQKFNSYANSTDVQEIKDELNKTLYNFKVVLSIDRLDYTKGIINRLRGYEDFLETNPEWHGKVVLIMVVVPSRIGVEHYQQMKNQIEQLIGRINGKFGNIKWTPILYQYKFLHFNELAALYSISDVALITPLRDGMNLIAKEYLASRTDKTGVLILSEMAGASRELGEAIIINPNYIKEIAEALKKALEMPEEEQVKHNEAMQKRLSRYNIVKWADEFIKELLSLQEEQKRFDNRLLNSAKKEQLIKDFKNAKKRLILLDYDGTLVPFTGKPHLSKPDGKILKILKHLSEDIKNEVVIISGRDKNTLNNWLGMLDIGLVAEHGAWIKEKNEDWKLSKPIANDWKSKILPILEMYEDRLPGSFVEEKEFSVVWHYRLADSEQSSIRVKELIDYLVNFTANLDIQILQGNKVVEIRNSGVNKGIAGMHWISKDNFGFILAIGDDWTDEDLFKILPDSAYSIRVGITYSYARFIVHNYMEILKLLEQLIQDE